MSPTLTQERSPSLACREAESPDPPFTLLLEAANVSVDPTQILTPPESPHVSEFNEIRKLSVDGDN